MGSRGPIPKRSSERAGHRAKADQPDQVPPPSHRVPVPAASKDWHAIPLRWYRSLRRSGQSRFFEPSDWAEAWGIADLWTRELAKVRVVTLPTGDEVIVPVPPGAMMMKTIFAAMGELGTTESSRRRMRIEVDRQTPDADASDDAIAILDDYRVAAGLG